MNKALAILLCLFSTVAGAAESAISLKRVGVDVFDAASIRRGAAYFADYCMGCHSLRQMRYSRIGKDLDLSEETMRQEFMLGSAKVHDYIVTALDPADGAAAFGVTPPDLSLVVRARGSDWVYSYLKGFYLDAGRPFGVNNLVVENVAMPNVLWALQGTQEAVMKRVGSTDTAVDVRLVQQGEMSPQEFDKAMRDLVNFLAYVAEPAQLQRLPLGKYVFLFLLILTVVLYKLKKEYWKEIP